MQQIYVMTHQTKTSKYHQFLMTQNNMARTQGFTANLISSRKLLVFLVHFFPSNSSILHIKQKVHILWSWTVTTQTMYIAWKAKYIKYNIINHAIDKRKCSKILICFTVYINKWTQLRNSTTKMFITEVTCLRLIIFPFWNIQCDVFYHNTLYSCGSLPISLSFSKSFWVRLITVISYTHRCPKGQT